MTEMLDSCCCQKYSQTMSTSPSASLKYDILTIATTTMTTERHRKRASANFCLTSMRNPQRSTMGNDRTIMSVAMSATVVMAVSRTTLVFPADPEQAVATLSSAWAKPGILSINLQSTFSTAVQGHVSKSATVAATQESVVIAKAHHHHMHNLGSRKMSLRKKNRKPNLTG